jgi:hypothetical protein
MNRTTDEDARKAYEKARALKGRALKYITKSIEEDGYDSGHWLLLCHYSHSCELLGEAQQAQGAENYGQACYRAGLAEEDFRAVIEATDPDGEYEELI